MQVLLLCKKEFRPKLIAAIDKIEAALGQNSTEGPFFFGSKWNAVDIILAPFIVRFPFLKYFREFTGLSAKHVRTLAYIEAISSNPEFQKVAFSYSQVLAFYKERVMILPTFSGNTLQHQAIRFRTSQIEELVKSMPADSNSSLNQLQEIWKKYVELIEAHSQYEEHVLFPVVEEKKEGVSKHAVDDHLLIVKLFQRISRGINKIKKKDLNSESRKKKIKKLEKLIIKNTKLQTEHMAGEEGEILPVAKDIQPADQVPITKKIFHNSKEEVNQSILPFILDSLTPPEADQYVHNLWVILKDDQSEWKKVLGWIKKGARADVWRNLLTRKPELIPISMQSVV